MPTGYFLFILIVITLFSVTQLLQIVEAREVALVGDALPDAAGGVALCQGHAVDAQEDVGGIHQSFHEGDAHLVDALKVPIMVFVSGGN